MRKDDFDVRVGGDGALEYEVDGAAGGLLWIVNHRLWEPGSNVARLAEGYRVIRKRQRSAIEAWKN